ALGEGLVVGQDHRGRDAAGQGRDVEVAVGSHVGRERPGSGAVGEDAYRVAAEFERVDGGQVGAAAEVGAATAPTGGPGQRPTAEGQRAHARGPVQRATTGQRGRRTRTGVVRGIVVGDAEVVFLVVL